MMESVKLDMHPIWDALLHVYEEFARVCDKNNLRYYLAEGSAIGALRHKGFIPWDDDLDVIMPRPDYERFRQICEKELPDYLKFVNYENAPEFQYTFGKVQDVRRDKVLEVERVHGAILPGGIYIDILVIDGAPSGILAKFIYKVKLLAFVCQQRFRTFCFSEIKNKPSKWLWIGGAVLSVFHPYEKWPGLAHRFENFMKSVPFETAELTWRDSATYSAVKLMYPREIWDGKVEVDFAGIKVPLPSGYDTYLCAQYGDYMTPPEKCRQLTTHLYSSRCPWWLGPTKAGADCENESVNHAS